MTKKMTNFLVKNEEKKRKEENVPKNVKKNTMKAKLKINYYPNITSTGHLHSS